MPEDKARAVIAAAEDALFSADKKAARSALGAVADALASGSPAALNSAYDAVVAAAQTADAEKVATLEKAGLEAALSVDKLQAVGTATKLVPFASPKVVDAALKAGDAVAPDLVAQAKGAATAAAGGAAVLAAAAVASTTLKSDDELEISSAPRRGKMKMPEGRFSSIGARANTQKKGTVKYSASKAKGKAGAKKK